MKKFIQITSMILALSIFLALPVGAATGNDQAEPYASSFFSSHNVFLHKTTSTSFQVWFDVVACGMMDELGVSEIKVERSSDGVTWTKMRTYFPSHYSQMICEDTFSHAGYVAFNDGIQGYYYRAYVTLYAKNSSGTGIKYRYTEVIRL